MNFSSSASIEKLSDNNYESWKLHIRSVLVCNDLWGYVSGTAARSTEDKSEDARKWDIKDEKALALILLSLKENQLTHVKKAKTAKEAWEILEKLHRSKGPSRKIMLYRKLFQMKKKGDQSMTEHLREFENNVDQMEEVGIKLPDELISIMLLNTLPEEFENFCIAIESRDTLPVLSVLKAKLIDEENRRKNISEEKDHGIGQSALFSNTNKNHNKNVQTANHPYNSGKNKFDGNCYFCKKYGHKSSECRKKKKTTSSKNTAMNAYMNKNIFDNDVWYVDSGATAHMCNDKNLFVMWKSQTHRLVHNADNSTMDAYGIGTVIIKGKNSDENKITLNDVMYVPKLSHNLISVSKATDYGNKIIFENNMVVIKNKNNLCVLKGRKIENLYAVGSEKYSAMYVNVSTNNNLVKWHQRMGHLNFKDLRKLKNENLVNGLNDKMEVNNVKCVVCEKAKIHQLPYRNSKKVDRDLLGTIHSDICGPFNVNSIGGASYFVTFIDEMSRYIEVAFLKKRSDVLGAFKKFQKFAERKTGNKIKRLRTDNAREYISKEFNEYLDSQGISRQLAVEYTPQQNGIAERANRTLLEMARCMLIESDLPKSLWAEAVNTAAFIRNRCPCSISPDKTPFELWTGKKPNVNFLKPFGCKVIALEKSSQRSKLDAKGKMYTFVGYCEESKAYRLWDSRKSVCKKRDVKFLEKINSNNYYFQDMPIGLHQVPESISDISENYQLIEPEPESSNDNEIIENQVPHEELFKGVSDEESFKGFTDEEYQTPTTSLKPSVESRRERRGRPRIERTGNPGRPRKIFADQVNFASIDPTNTISFESIIESENKSSWVEAMNSELQSLNKNNTWQLVQRPVNKKILSNRWVFCIKKNSDGSPRHKARLVVRGCEQTSGIDYNEVYAPVARYETMRTMFAICAELQLHLHQMDVVTAYVQGDLEEEIYMEMPQQPDIELDTSKVCKLQKPLYGLKQAARQWHKKLSTYLKSLGMKQTFADQCVYVKHENNTIIIILVYVDDLLIASSSLRKIEEIKQLLSLKFEMKDLGIATNILGITVERKSNTGDIEIHQKDYITKLVEKFNMTDAKPVSTPLDISHNLTQPPNPEANEDKEIQDKPYRELIGSLTYLTNTVRPDIAFAVNLLSRFSNNPSMIHWVAAKRILRYLKGTADYTIKYVKCGTPLKCYVDSDWGGDSQDRKSCYGYFIMFGGGPISWKSKKQQCVALSTMEAEYVALTEGTKEVMYQRRFFTDLELHSFCNGETVVYCDNQSAISLSKNPTNHEKSKHIDIKYHYCKQMQHEKNIKVIYISTSEMIADILTKGLTKVKHENCIKMLNL